MRLIRMMVHDRARRLRAALVIAALACAACLVPPTAVLDDPESYCSDRGMFYCNSYQVSQTLPNDWVGTCGVPVSDFPGIVGYVGHTYNGGETPAFPTLEQAQDFCTVAGVSGCVNYTQCKRH